MTDKFSSYPSSLGGLFKGYPHDGAWRRLMPRVTPVACLLGPREEEENGREEDKTKQHDVKEPILDYKHFFFV